MACLFTNSRWHPASGCYAVNRSGTLCQGLPQGDTYLLVAAAASALFTLVVAAFGAAVRSCCGSSACTRVTLCATPTVLLGTGVCLFDWLTDANFYATLSLDDKSSILGCAPYANSRGRMFHRAVYCTSLPLSSRAGSILTQLGHRNSPPCVHTVCTHAGTLASAASASPPASSSSSSPSSRAPAPSSAPSWSYRTPRATTTKLCRRACRVVRG
jgi:hypothetical protein